MATKYAQHVSTRNTPVNEKIPGTNQVPNSTGGYAFPVDCWARMRRFLILGNEGGSYYASEKKMTVDNASCINECYLQDPEKAINLIVEVSEGGLAPKNDPAIFALAMLSRDSRALAVVHRVCRIPTHLFQFVEAAQNFRGRGRAFQRTLQHWYLNKGERNLAYQLSKYQQRDGWSNRDILRLCRPTPKNDLQKTIFGWATGKIEEVDNSHSELSPIWAFEQAKSATSKKEIVSLIRDYDLVRECIPTDWLNYPEVWDALLEKMPLTAMIRNLGKMGSVGLLKPMSNSTRRVVEKLADSQALQKARIHPLALLVAQRIYSLGHGLRGSLSWDTDSSIVDALDDAFYEAFKFVEPTGKRHLLAIDVSGSMGFGCIAGMPITPREGAAAMSMVALKTEQLVHTVGFSHNLVKIPLSKKQRLDDVIRTTSSIPMGATDIAAPMDYALRNGIETDVFIIYTDSEANRGDDHACQALVRYREKMGIPAKMVVVGMISNGFSVADPRDAGMMDVVGFDTSAPAVMSDFIR